MPDDAPRPQPEVGHKPPRAHFTVLRWIAYGVLAFSPLGLWLWMVGAPADLSFTISCGLGGGAGLPVGLLVAALGHMPPDNRALMWACIRWWMVGGGVVMGLLCGLLFSSTPPPHPERAAAVGLLAILVGALMGGLVGILHGFMAVRMRLHHERRQFEVAQYEAVEREAALDARRGALVAAITTKFGPPDAAQREDIQTWDEARIADAVRRLAEARTIEELG